MLSLGAEDFPEQQGLGRAIHKGSGERDHRVSNTATGRVGGRSKRSNSADGLNGVWEWFGVVVLFTAGRSPASRSGPSTGCHSGSDADLSRSTSTAPQRPPSRRCIARCRCPSAQTGTPTAADPAVREAFEAALVELFLDTLRLAPRRRRRRRVDPPGARQDPSSGQSVDEARLSWRLLSAHSPVLTRPSTNHFRHDRRLQLVARARRAATSPSSTPSRTSHSLRIRCGST